VRAVVLAVAVLAAVLAPDATDAPDAPDVARTPAPVRYQAPVDAPVTDPFRPPSSPYGPGNRGLEYATEPGTPVRAAADGTATFAGQVGGTLHVTLQHADGARTTYAGLATVGVTRGEQVAAGEPVGTSRTSLLWTVRLGDAYLDPAALLAASGDASSHLVAVSPDWPLEAAPAPP
jgi:murein DD-endopeptidase MepM/ murein hydrolase activator NlpD